MTVLRWLLVAFAVVQGGWMVVDGSRALVVGDYFTPRAGRYAGQLGPWSNIVRKVGVEPRSVPMKVAFVVFGVAWLIAAVLILARVPAGVTLLMIVAIASLWYAPIGTTLSVAALGSALWLRKLQKKGGRDRPPNQSTPTTELTARR